MDAFRQLYGAQMALLEELLEEVNALPWPYFALLEGRTDGGTTWAYPVRKAEGRTGEAESPLDAVLEDCRIRAAVFTRPA